MEEHYSLSDSRFKTDITAINAKFAEELISKIEVVRYKWKKNPKKTFNYGVVAQQVNEVAPELVTSDINGILSVNYQNFTSLIIAAIQDILTRIDAIENLSLIKKDEDSSFDSNLESNSGGGDSHDGNSHNIAADNIKAEVMEKSSKNKNSESANNLPVAPIESFILSENMSIPALKLPPSAKSTARWKKIRNRIKQKSIVNMIVVDEDGNIHV